MEMLSEDDRNLREMTAEELALAWDLWFDIAQTTNDNDPPYTHGVFAGTEQRQKTRTDRRKNDRTDQRQRDRTNER